MPDSLDHKFHRDAEYAGPDTVHGTQRLAAPDVQKLRRRLDALEKRAREESEESAKFDSLLTTIGARPMLTGHASLQGANRFASRFGKAFTAFYRPAQDILISSLGIGTNRGAMDRETDISYARAIQAALRGGINLIDTSLNYRHQHSERAAAAALRAFVEDSGGARDAVVVCTKGGYVVPGAFAENTLSADTVTGDMHCMAPAFLADQISRSRKNLGVETIDVYYLHNPETQLRFVEMPVFMKRVRAAFEQFERFVSEGFVRHYGTATWHGYRTGALSLRALVDAAREVAGDSHHFRFVQLPFNIKMQEATTYRDQHGETVRDVARELGITVVASASLGQLSLWSGLPVDLSEMFEYLPTNAQWAIQFARSTPGISSALVGMREVAHVMENLAVAQVPLLTSDEYQALTFW